MKKKSLSLDKEIVLQQEDIDGGYFSGLITDCVIAIAIGVAAGIITEHLNHPSEAFTCGCTENCPTGTCASCNGTCNISCNGSCGCISYGMCPA